MAQKRIQIEILVEGLPANHSIVADLAKWNVRVHGIKNPIPFEFHGTWLFQDDAMINEIVEAGGFCGGLCWALHSSYPSYMVSNISPGNRSIKCDVIIKHSVEDEFLQAIDDGTMSKVLQSSMKEIPNKFNNLQQLYEPIKIIRIKKISDDSKTPSEHEYITQNLEKEMEYWKNKAAKLIKSRIEVELERDRSRVRCKELQKSLRDAEERNVKLIQNNTRNDHKISEEIAQLKIELHKEEQKSQLFERENKEMQNQISEMEITKLQIENSKEQRIEDYDKVLHENLNLKATVQSMEEEIKLEVQKFFTLKEDLKTCKEEVKTLKNQLEDKEVQILGYDEVLQEKLNLEDTVKSLEADIKLEVQNCLTLKEDLKMSREETKTLKNLLGNKEEEILKWRSRSDNLEIQFRELDETCELLKESIESQHILAKDNGTDSLSTSSLISENSSGEDDKNSEDFNKEIETFNSDIKKLQNKIDDNENTVTILIEQIDKSEKQLRDSELEAKKLRESQRKTEVRMEAREQAHRDQVVALKKEIDELQLQLVTGAKEK